MTPGIAVIGGLAAQRHYSERGLLSKRLGAVETPYGQSQPISLVESPSGDYLFLARFGECERAVPPHMVNHRANIHALHSLGVQLVVAFNDTKAVTHNYRVGEFVIVADLIDETALPAPTFVETLEDAQVRQWPVFCPSLRQELSKALQRESLHFGERGVFVCVAGHRQETPAEARKYGAYGGDLIGRALAPEAFLAKELQLSYASLAYVSAYAETGSTARPYESGAVLSEGDEHRRIVGAIERLPVIMGYMIESLAAAGKLPRPVEQRTIPTPMLERPIGAKQYAVGARSVHRMP